jgi:2-amino-4-hydroxy-6-hydroxymethyldihydropteridine diphosphokinase
MATALVALGSNLGDRRELLDQALRDLADCAAIEVLAVSGYRETVAVGGPAGQAAFLNAAARLRTALEPQALLDELQAIEQRLGRVRTERWGPRSVDLDLLLYEELQLDTPRLTLPHPRMAFRRFVLEPAAEVGGELLHATTGWTVSRLLEHLNSAKPYVVVLTAGLEPFFAALGSTVSATLLRFDWDRYRRSKAEVQAAVVCDYAAALEEARWPADRGVVLGDCSLELLRARHAADHAVARAVDDAAKPRLTIVCCGPRPAKLPADFGVAALDDAAVRAKLHTYAISPGHGPSQWIAAPDLAAAIDEAVAALRAVE